MDLVVALLLLGALATVWLRRGRKDRARPAVGKAAFRLGLAPGAMGHGAHGEIGGFEVEIDERRVVIHGEDAFPPDLQLRAAASGRGRETGDPHFDAVFEAAGSDATLAAALGAEVRAKVLELLGPRQGWVAGGALGAWVERDAWDPEGLAVLVRQLVALVEAMDFRRVSLRSRLAETASADPCAGVRRRALAVLARLEGPPQAVLRGALRDRDPGVRVEAAVALGEEGLLVAACEARDTPDASRALALAALLPRLEASRSLDLASLALTYLAPQSHLVGLDFLNTAAPLPGPWVGRLCGFLQASGALLGPAATALARHGGSASEGALVEALERLDGDPPGGLALALGRVGGSAALRALRGLRERARLSPSVATGVDDAIDAIRGRLPPDGALSAGEVGAEAGALSVGPPTGELAFPMGTKEDKA